MYRTESKRQDWKCQMWQCHYMISLSIISVKPFPEACHQRLFGKHQVSCISCCWWTCFEKLEIHSLLYITNCFVTRACCHSNCKTCSLRDPTTICIRPKHQTSLGIQFYLIIIWIYSAGPKGKAFWSANDNSPVPVNGQGPNPLTEYLAPLLCVPEEEE